MSLILDGTNGLSDVDGTAGTPAIRGSDANTGIFFPAADTIAFAEGGVESMRLDSAGNVGIGTSSPSAPLDIARGASVAAYTSYRGNGNASSAEFFVGQGGNNFGYIYNRANGPIEFATNNITRALIDASGNLLVGTTANFTSRLTVEQSINDHMVRFNNTQASGSIYGPIFRFTGQTPNNTTSEFMACLDPGGYRMVVRANGGIANFSGNNVNLSDRREKTNFAPAKSYLETICAIPVQTFNYIDQNHEEDPGLTLGVVAQDVQAVAPELVMESNWGTKEEPKMRLSVYQTDLQYALMKCIQEQQTIIESLTARIEALENQT